MVTVGAIGLLERAIIVFSNTDAMCTIASLLKNDRKGLQRNIKRSVTLYERAIEDSSHIDAMNKLAGLLTSNVDGLERDTKSAVQLLERSIAEMANADGLFLLAVLLGKGADDVLPRNAGRAMQLYEQCLETQPPSTVLVECLVRLSNVLKVVVSVRGKQFFDESLSVLRDPSVLTLYAGLFQAGAPGVERNVGKAKELYEVAVL